jgi:lipopolysaccharide transport system ATP-binding protein
MSIIHLAGVSKRFTLRHDRPRSLQDLFFNILHLKFTPAREDFWVLRNIDLEVKPGEMLGVIGPNGAGKSTLLKLLSRIFEPTSGQMEINGRVGALLELGAGFHPDLTGRENIYLNGSILGFGRAEMARMYDDIVAFSEMERFIDIPMRQYSSGMFMRLGFSVAIHLQPDILLVDEVLAVGDRAYQARCLDRIREMRQQGVTIVFVSHNLGQVQEMCNRAVWLENGHVEAEGTPEQVIHEYASQLTRSSTQALQKAQSSDSTGTQPGASSANKAQIVQVQLLDREGHEQRSFRTGETFTVRIHFVAHQRIEHPLIGLALYESSGFHINGPNTALAGLDIESIEGPGYIDYVVESLPLLEGTYLVSTALYDQAGIYPYDYHHQAYIFHVHPSEDVTEEHGSILIPSHWQMGPVGEEVLADQ